jgi:beta-galactosidase/beta-glucuronidase
MKRNLLLAIILFVSVQQIAVAQTVNLKWKLFPQNDAEYTAEKISAAGFNTKNWIDAVVPGTVFHSYVVAGKEANPDYADNIYKVDKAKYNKPYWYRAEFSTKAFAAGKRIWLNFNGVNKMAEVYLNGRHIGTIKGLMQRGKYDITDRVSNTKQTLLLC